MTNETYQFLLQEHTRALKGFAYHFTRDVEDADDLYQDTMVKAIRYRDNFQQGTNFKAWLMTIMRNTFINNYRKKVKRVQVISAEEIQPNQLSSHVTSNGAVGKFAMADIQRALDLLPRDHHYPFIKHFEGYKYHEIATQMNIPIGTVKTKIHMARMLLKKQLKNYVSREV